MANVLIVDDEKSIRLTLEAFLRDAGHHVFAAADEAGALALVEEHAFDVLVADILLGDTNGLDVAGHILERQPNVQVIFCTGKPEVTSARKAIRLHAFDYLAKPVGKQQILDVVARAADEKQRLDDYEQLQADRNAHRERLECEVRERTMELASSEARFRTLFAGMAQGVFWQRADGELIDCNAAVLEQFGLTRDQFLGRTSIHPDWKVVREDGSDWPGEEHPSMVALQTGRPALNVIAGVFNPVRREYVWLSINAIPSFRDGEDRPQEVFVTTHDLTDLRHAEQELARAAREWQSTFDATNDAVFLLDPDHRVLRSNAATERFLGIPVSELTGRRCFELVHGEGAPIPECPLKRASQSLQREQMELPRGDRWYHVTVDPVIDANGAYAGAVHIMRDVTELKRAQNELQRERDLAKSYLDIAGVMLIALDDRQTITMINRRGCEILGAAKGEIIGKNWFDTFLPAEQVDDIKAVYDKILTGDVEPMEYHDNPIVRADGKQRTIAWHNSVLRDSDGAITGLLSSGEDVTERRRADQARQHSEFLLSRAQELGHIGTWTLDMVNNVLAWTEENYKIFGIPVGTPLTYEAFVGCVHPDDRDYVNREWTSHMQTNDYDIEHRLLVDGQVRWVREKAEITFDEDGCPVNAVGFTQDITERKRLAAELAHRRENLENEVRERTQELDKIVTLMTGREVRMSELKQSVRTLREQLLEAGIEPMVGGPSLVEEDTEWPVRRSARTPTTPKSPSGTGRA